MWSKCEITRSMYPATGTIPTLIVLPIMKNTKQAPMDRNRLHA